MAHVRAENSAAPMPIGRGLHYLSLSLAVGTFILIGWGGLVNSTGSGLSVPDWPTTYGYHLFLYPISEWRGGILYEHTHRLLAAVVGFLAFGHVLWSWLMVREEPYRWIRSVSLAAFLLVVLQGVLGGLTVLLRLPTAISASHAMVAQTFFAFTLWLALGTRPQWYSAPALRGRELRRRVQLAAVVGGVTFCQIFFGALTRHTYSALAIPDFPLVFGGLFPPRAQLNEQVLVHYVHRVVGFLLTGLMLWQGWTLWRSPTAGLRRWGIAGIVAILAQLLVGGWLVWSLRAVIPTTVHGLVGTAIWAINVVILLQLWRWHQLEQRAWSR